MTPAWRRALRWTMFLTDLGFVLYWAVVLTAPVLMRLAAAIMASVSTTPMTISMIVTSLMIHRPPASTSGLSMTWVRGLSAARMFINVGKSVSFQRPLGSMYAPHAFERDARFDG